MKKLTKKFILYKVFYYLSKIDFLSRWSSVKLKIGSSKFTIPIINGIGLSHIVESEKWMDNVLRIVIPLISEKCVLDVGVNIGQTLLKVKAISPKMHYMGFEPNMQCINYLNQLVELNSIENVTLIPAGLSNQTQIMQLHFYSDLADDASASLVRGFRSNSKKKENVVALHPKDVALLMAADLGCIKIDVEGGELEVIEGLLQLIVKKEPVIICEILPCYDQEKTERVERQNQLQSLIKTRGYEIYRINIYTNKITKVNDIGIHSNLDESNYIFLSKTSKVRNLILEELGK